MLCEARHLDLRKVRGRSLREVSVEEASSRQPAEQIGMNVGFSENRASEEKKEVANNSIRRLVINRLSPCSGLPVWSKP